MRLNQIFKSLTVAAIVAMAFTGVQAADITGAGATFPYPIYAKWAEGYKKATGTGMNYQSIGSGGGIKQIKAKTVDFGASDMPLKAEELETEGLLQFPAIMGGVVTVVNLEGIKPGQLKLTGDVVAAIDKLFELRFDALVSSMQLGKPPRGLGGSGGAGHGGGGRKPRHLH